MNEREVYLRYPREAFEWWLRHDGWKISDIEVRPKPLLKWRSCHFVQKQATAYNDIPTIDSFSYKELKEVRNLTTDDWVSFKAFGIPVLSIVFAFFSIPVIRKYNQDES